LSSTSARIAAGTANQLDATRPRRDAERRGDRDPARAVVRRVGELERRAGDGRRDDRRRARAHDAGEVRALPDPAVDLRRRRGHGRHVEDVVDEIEERQLRDERVVVLPPAGPPMFWKVNGYAVTLARTLSFEPNRLNEVNLK
jgi:hypothetical protein